MAHAKRLSGNAQEKVADAYRAIGRFITSCSDLDAILSSVVAAIFLMDGVGHPLIVHAIDFNRKRELLRALRAFEPPDRDTHVWDTIHRLVDKADRLMGYRNTVAHGMLVGEGGEFHLVGLGLPALAKIAANKTDTLKVSRLDALSDQADELTTRLLAINDALEARQKLALRNGSQAEA